MKLEQLVVLNKLELKTFFIFPASTMYQESDRNPIMRNYINNLPGSRDNPESIANFYSPMDSPEGEYRIQKVCTM